MMNLELLMNKNPIAFYELLQKCRNPKHAMFGNSVEIVEKLGLMNSGLVHGTVKNIVLSAVAGDDLEMTINSPIVEKRNFTNNF